MACKERQKDIELLKVIAQRNANKLSEPEDYFLDITWEGSILDISSHIAYSDNVVSVIQVQPGSFVATVKRSVK